MFSEGVSIADIYSVLFVWRTNLQFLGLTVPDPLKKEGLCAKYFSWMTFTGCNYAKVDSARSA